MASFSTQNYSTKRFRLGTIKKDIDGKEYIFLKGGTSVVVNTWVSYPASTYVAVLLAADAIGSVAIAQGTVTASQYGWFLVKGYYATASTDTVAGANGLFIDGTAGRADDASVAGDMIYGAVSTGADVTNLCPVYLNYPYVTNTVPA